MTASPSTTAAIPIDPRISAIAAAIAAAIPSAQVRLCGSRAQASPVGLVVGLLWVERVLSPGKIRQMGQRLSPITNRASTAKGSIDI